MGIRKNNAFTLQELLVVIAVIAVMVVILISTVHVLKKQSDLRDAKSTLLVLSTALEKFHELRGRYPFYADPYLPGLLVNDATDDSGYDRDDLAANIIAALGLDAATPYTPFVYSEENNYQASIEGLYFFLRNNPATNEILGSIPDKYLTVKDASNSNLNELLVIPSQPNPVQLIRIVDPWGTPYRYTCQMDGGIAVVESAGPDKMFARTPPGDDTVEDQKDLDNISY